MARHRTYSLEFKRLVAQQYLSGEFALAALACQHDGKMLDALKLLDGGKIHLPRQQKDYSDRNQLVQRFQEFRGAA